MCEVLNENGWNLNYGNVVLMWCGGCIICFVFLGNICDVFEKNLELVFLGFDVYFKGILDNCLVVWCKVVVKLLEVGILMLCMILVLIFFDGYIMVCLLVNLL